MRRPFEPGPRPRGLEPWLGEVPDSLFDDRVYAVCELADRYATETALDLARALGIEAPLARGGTVDELLAACGLAPSFRPALERLLDRLAGAGEIEREDGSPPRYRAAGPLPPGEVAELRTLGLEFAPELAATLDLFDAAARAYPAAARGEAAGEELLLAPASVELWLRYFSNENPVYALSNRIAALAAAHRLPAAGPLRILEVGAGAGSAALALLEELERAGRLADVALYDVTEPSPFFRRRAERALRARFPGLALRSRALDLDSPFENQGGAQGYDLVFGVNVVHVARDLGASLARLREALVPGGALVAGECFRLFPGQAVPADLVFQLFRAFTEVRVDGVFRPHHGFLSPEAWRTAFAAAGFAEVAVVPDLERIRERYARFFAGAICGRRTA
ncbi:MAG TPA: methyltransferase [Thermoanaerobaculia bacterium]|nr:methyltransferase [Thermoanaerobaculia bacterium]